MRNKNELLAEVVKRYQFHKSYSTDDAFLGKIAETMCDIDLDEMWMLTQK